MDTNKCQRLVNRLSSGSFKPTYDALIELRTKVPKSRNDIIEKLLELDIVPKLLKLISSCLSFAEEEKKKTTDIVLSILGNLCMQTNARKNVQKHGGIPVVANHLCESESESIQNRSCRTLANLALDPSNNHFIHKTEAVEKIAILLESVENKDCLLTFCRAIRLLGHSVSDIDKLVEVSAVTAVAKLIKSSVKEVQNCSLRTIHDLSNIRCCSNFASQILAADVLEVLVKCADDSDDTVSQHALSTLCRVVEQENIRPAFGAAGGIPYFIGLLAVDNLNFSKVSILNVICMCSKEAVNRVKIRESGGLNILLDKLSDPRFKSLHNRIISTFLCYLYDEHSLDVLLENGLIPLLVLNMRRCIQIDDPNNDDLHLQLQPRLLLSAEKMIVTSIHLQRLEGLTSDIQSYSDKSLCIPTTLCTCSSCYFESQKLSVHREMEKLKTNNSQKSGKEYIDGAEIPATVTVVQRGNEKAKSYSNEVGQNKETTDSTSSRDHLYIFSVNSPTYKDENDWDIGESPMPKCKQSFQRTDLASPAYPASNSSFSPLSSVSYYSNEYSPPYSPDFALNSPGSDTSDYPCSSPIVETTGTWSPLALCQGSVSPPLESSSPKICSSPIYFDDETTTNISLNKAHDLENIIDNNNEASYSGNFKTTEKTLTELSFCADNSMDSINEQSSLDPNLTLAKVDIHQSKLTESKFPLESTLSHSNRSACLSGIGSTTTSKTSIDIVKMDRDNNGGLHKCNSATTTKESVFECTDTKCISVLTSDGAFKAPCHLEKQLASENSGRSSQKYMPTKSTASSNKETQQGDSFSSQSRKRKPTNDISPISENAQKRQKVSLNRRKSVIVTERNILMILSRASQMPDPVQHLVTSQSSHTKMFPERHHRSCLSRSNSMCETLFPGEYSQCSAKFRTLRSSSMDVSSESIDDEDKCKTRTITNEDRGEENMAQHGLSFLECLSFVLNSRYGRGVITGFLQKASVTEDQRQWLAVCVPFLCWNKEMQHYFLIRMGILEEIFQIIEDQIMKKRWQYAVCGLSFLVKLKNVKLELKCVNLELLKSLFVVHDTDLVTVDVPEKEPKCRYKNSTTLFDLTFQVGKTEVKACKETLVNSSAVFSAMLTGQYAESGQSKISLQDTSSEALIYILHYLHGCDLQCETISQFLSNQKNEICNNLLRKCLQVITMADKYLLIELLNFLKAVVVSKFLTTKTAVEIYNFADFHEYAHMAMDSLKCILIGCAGPSDILRNFLNCLQSPMSHRFLDSMKSVVTQLLNID
ncbi:hypothetical protein ScPMuIL_006945 [Solemya velum]